MTAYTYLTISCDWEALSGEECSAATHWPLPVATHSELRRLRRPGGWRTRRPPSGGPLLDLCPKHANTTPKEPTSP